ncbi:MAG: hypothetical protein REI45_15270 [Propionicimonas sp.]|nr:hypothetical protein [Propionicimonas sp.]
MTGAVLSAHDSDQQGYGQTPSPADVFRRRPAGTAGGKGGQFQEKRNDAPAAPLAATPAPQADDELPIPDLVDEIPGWVRAEDEHLRAEYRDLWKRLNAKHRSSTYADAVRLSAASTDPAELAVLSQLQAPGVSLKVAQNPATAGPVLHMLAVGESDFRDPDVRRAAVAHPNCPEATIRIVWAHRRVLDYPGIGKTAVPSAPNTPIDVLEDAALEGDSVAARRLHERAM